MKNNNKYKFLSGIFAAFFAVLISDMHIIFDLFIILFENNNHNIYIPLFISGLVAGPATAFTLFIFAKEISNSIRMRTLMLNYNTVLMLYLFAIAHILLSIADVYFGYTIMNAQGNFALVSVLHAGAIRGIFTVLTAIFGTIFTLLLLRFFRESKNENIGYYGAITVIFCVILGVLIKTLSIFIIPILLINFFAILMIIKGVGFVMMCIGLNRLNEKV